MHGRLPRTGIPIVGHDGAVLLHILLCITFLFHTAFFLYFILYIVPSSVLYFILYSVAGAMFGRFFGYRESQLGATFGMNWRDMEVLIP